MGGGGAGDGAHAGRRGGAPRSTSPTSSATCSAEAAAAADRSRSASRDIEAETTIDFRDAILGTTMALSFNGEPTQVKIPEGIGDGQNLRIRRWRSEPGQPAGDPPLVHVRPHPLFERRGDDIHIELPITVGEAIRGADVEVPTIHGPVRMRIPAGTQGGQHVPPHRQRREEEERRRRPLLQVADRGAPCHGRRRQTRSTRARGTCTDEDPRVQS